MDNRNFGLDTLALHAGFSGDPGEGSTEVPIHATSAYHFSSTEQARELFELKASGNIYSRISNPTVTVLEERIAALEDGTGAVAFSSGHAAMFSAMLCLAEAGDEIISSINIYGGAINMFAITLGNLGIKVRFVSGNNPADWEALVTPKTKAFFLEAVGNPNANVADLSAVGAVAKKHGIPFIVDSTFTTPALLRPKEWGADIIIHSATKFLCGHGNSLAGLAVDCGTFNFLGNPRFPKYNTPDVSYHGTVFARDFAAAPFATRLRCLFLRDLGGCLSPFNAYLVLLGMETLSLRMARHCENALTVAKYLAANPDISFVSYPALPDAKDYSLVQKYLGGRGGAVFTFGLCGGREAGGKFIDSLQLIGNVANVGDTKTQVIHPATTTHSQLDAAQLAASGITEQTIRISVGLETVSDLIADIEQAIAKTK
ncbi:MAG: O-acetylhomoserine aminocarboxypropyltransferase/cysteine synthase family protein [Angelakisella sp.]